LYLLRGIVEIQRLYFASNEQYSFPQLFTLFSSLRSVYIGCTLSVLQQCFQMTIDCQSQNQGPTADLKGQEKTL